MLLDDMTRREYSAIHYWVYKTAGKPSVCEECGTKSPRYEWANLSGIYKMDMSDWRRMCVSCHLKMDRQYKCRNGHSRTEENTEIRKNGWRNCKVCKRETAHRVYLGRKESGIYG